MRHETVTADEEMNATLTFRDIRGVETKDLDADERTVTHVISTAGRDRGNDVVDVGGWDVEKFLTNPVVLADHRYGVGGIIGRAVELRSTRRALVAKTQFHDVGLGAAAFDLVANGMARAWSVGFRGLEAHSLQEGAKKLKCATCKRERNAIIGDRNEDDIGYIHGRHYTKQELMEYSLVAVPANADAVMEYIGKGYINEDNASALFRPDEADHFGELSQKIDQSLRVGSVTMEQIEALASLVKELRETVTKLTTSSSVYITTEEETEVESQIEQPADDDESPAPKVKAVETETETEDSDVVEEKPRTVDIKARESAMAVIGAELRRATRGAEIKAALSQK